jgi:hypothetical protein
MILALGTIIISKQASKQTPILKTKQKREREMGKEEEEEEEEEMMEFGNRIRTWYKIMGQ